MMKYAFAALCAFVVLGCAYSVDLNFMAQMKECGSEMGISPDQVMEMVAKNDPQLDCVRSCVLEKLGAMNNGQLDKNVLLSILDQNKDTIPNYDQMRGNIDMCYGEATTSGLTDRCQLGGKFGSCMQRQMAGVAAGMLMNGASQIGGIMNKFSH